jgi:N-acetylmuramoyl-L-alanine amidase
MEKMNQSTAGKYNFSMRKLLIPIILLLLAANSQAEIRAFWKARNIKADINSVERDQIQYVSLSNLAEFLGRTNDADLRKGIGSIKLENGQLDYVLSSPYVTVGEKSYNIQHDIIFYRGDFYAPLDNIVEVIDRLMSDELVCSADGETLTVLPARYNILDLTAQQKLNGLMVEILLSEELKYDLVQTDDYWLIATIYEGKIDTSYFNNKRPVRAIYDTRAYQFDNSAQISIRLRPKEFTYVGKLKENPLRIQIMIKGEGFADTTLSYTPGNDMKSNKIDVVVIDPGHGGEDEGAIGPSGTKEKDINLKISKKLKGLLEDDGFQVLLTRDDDRFISLSDRTKIANEAGADLFVSIHCNASARNKKARGYISFFLSDAKTDQARAAAALENSAIRFESSEEQRDYVSDIDFILLDMVQSEFLKESSDLAAMIEQNIVKRAKLDSRGVDQAGFFVLNKAYMPSVLVETAFMSNKDDEKFLKNDKNQGNVAKAIAEAIKEFKVKYEAMK